MEILFGHDFRDGSRAWIAQSVFAPLKSTYGPWEKTGIRADISAPTRWDLFTEANDPALAAAVEALLPVP